MPQSYKLWGISHVISIHTYAPSALSRWPARLQGLRVAAHDHGQSTDRAFAAGAGTAPPRPLVGCQDAPCHSSRLYMYTSIWLYRAGIYNVRVLTVLLVWISEYRRALSMYRMVGYTIHTYVHVSLRTEYGRCITVLYTTHVSMRVY